MAVTMQDIANRAGVSRPVVSAVLGGRSTCRVSEVKRRLILDLVEEFHFQRNRQASCLRQGRKAEAGVFLPDWNSVLILKLIRGLTGAAQENGIPLHYYFGMQMASYEHFIHAMAKSRHSAILSYVPFYSEKTTPELSAQLQQYIEDGGRVVTLNTRHWEIPQCCSVGIDEYHGGVIAAEYLRQRNCASYIAVGLEDSESARRYQGFKDHLQYSVRWLNLPMGGVGPARRLEQALPVLLEQLSCPVGIFCMNERISFQVSRILDQQHRIGRDYYFISYEELERPLFHSGAGRIVQPFEEMGRQAIRMLSRCFNGEEVGGVLLKPRLDYSQVE